MNETQLSKRLSTVVQSIPIGSRIADIGSDHAYLPCYAYKHGIITYAIAGEVNEGPYQSAVEQVKRLNYENAIDVRKGNGLQVLSKGEVDVITIAGMGGPLIASILESGKEKLPGIKRLILQPNVAANQIRTWLEENHWVLLGEEIVEEDGIIYEVLWAEQEGVRPYSKENYELEILLGPILMRKKSETFIRKWKQELKEWRKILLQFEKAKQNEEVTKKQKELLEKIQLVEEVIQWQS